MMSVRPPPEYAHLRWHWVRFAYGYRPRRQDGSDGSVAVVEWTNQDLWSQTRGYAHITPKDAVGLFVYLLPCLEPELPDDQSAAIAEEAEARDRPSDEGDRG